MDQNHAGCAVTRRFFKFVGPAAVIGHRLAAELARDGLARSGLEVGIVTSSTRILPCMSSLLKSFQPRSGASTPYPTKTSGASWMSTCFAPFERRQNRDLGSLLERNFRAVLIETDVGRSDNLGFEERHFLEPATLAVDRGRRQAERLLP